jgi:tetrahydromethanopterin S-methyltransferase subunit G
MQKLTLPIILQLALRQHACAADIEDDDELKNIMLRLSELNEKVEAIKHKARLRRGQQAQ